VEKYDRDRQATEDITALRRKYVIFMPDN